MDPLAAVERFAGRHCVVKAMALFGNIAMLLEKAAEAAGASE